jgi:hypothetical protein
MSLPEFDAKLKALFADHKQRDDRLFEIFRKEDDLVSVVLRGHLVVEKLLFSAVAAHCVYPRELDSVQFRFPQLVALIRALQKLPAVSNKLWVALTELNSLRNALAHNLEPHDLSARVERFVRCLGDEDSLLKLPGPPSSKESLRAALSYLIGAMGVVSMFQEATEELIMYQLKTANQKPNAAGKSST